MNSLDQNRICPKCGSSDLLRIRRTLWMRLAAVDGEHYRCMDCQKPFLYSVILNTLGRFLAGSVIAFLLITFVLDTPPTGCPGVGPLEIAGYALGAVITTLGLILIYKSK